MSVAAERGASPPPDPRFARCEPPPGQPWTYEELTCLRQVGTVHHARDHVVRRLHAMGAGHVDHPWPTLVLAHVRLEQLRRDEAIALYETAAGGFARSADAEGEVVARQNLASQFRLRGDVPAASRHVARATAAAEASKQPLVIARAAVIEAVHSMATGGDIGGAHRVLLRADRLVPSTAPIGLRRTILFNLANASLHLGDADAAIDALERHRALRAEDGSAQNAATVEFNLLIARLTMSERRPRAGAREQLVANAKAVLAEAKALSDPLVEAQAHQVLGDLLAVVDPGGAAKHLDRCLAVEATLGFPGVRAACLWSRARLESSGDPRRVEQSSQQALSLLDAGHDRLLLAYAWQARLRLAWRTLAPDAAFAQSREALDAIERLRVSEAGEGSRASLFANWTRDYQWLTGQLLQATPPRLAHALETGERLRARVLLEQVARAGTPDTATAARGEGGRQLDRRIALAQRRLLSPAADAAERPSLLAQLRLLELEREELIAGQLRPVPSNAAPFASIDTIQRALNEQEAMVWFSIAPWKDVYGAFGGGAFAVTITRQSATVHPLSTSDGLDAQVTALAGLLRDRRAHPSVWQPPARRLGETLFGDALARLPPTISRLVIVTDGALHRMPFEALSLRSGPMLGERFALSEAPSATLWLRLREARAAPPGNGVLVLADPDVRGGTPDGVLRLDRLPGARREAQAIARLLDLGTHAIAEGAAASERLVKHTSLGNVGVLHLAAHARADAAFPERSAVFLAPGDTAEDGWLQPGEIARLDFRGRLVVLSACDSAEGSLLPGEGPLSLARAFFAGGASSVVATRWPLRDDDAAFMMERFYQALGTGQSVSTALREARHAAIKAGLPAAAWAGIAALGDGELRPIAPRPARGALRPWAGAIAVLLIGGGTWLRRRRQRRDH